MAISRPPSQSISLDSIFATAFDAALHDGHGHDALIDVDRPRLARRMRALARQRRSSFNEASLLPCNTQPFDGRWTYLDPVRHREYLEHVDAGTDWLAVTASGTSFLTRGVAVATDERLRMIPMHRVAFGVKSPNLTREARHYALRQHLGECDLFHHSVAVLAAQNDGSRSIPLPESKELVRFSAILGERVARLCADECDLKAIAVASRVGKEARMLRGSVLELDERWSVATHVVVRPVNGDELVALSDQAGSSGLTTDEVITLLGSRTCDVYLNEKAFWRNVPLHVWNHRHGDTPLLESWIRARLRPTLGRALVRDEVAQFSSAARRISGLLLLRPALERNLGVLTMAT